MPANSKPLQWPPGGILRTDHDGPAHLIMCPCGCGKVWTCRHAVASGSVETGDLTLTPSIVMTWESIGCGWHGFLVDGTFTSV